MDSGGRLKPAGKGRRKKIPVGIPGTVLGSAVLGAAIAVSLLRVMQDGTEPFSTAGLLILLFLTGLSVAAIVLSSVAASLSRAAEHAITRQSEELRALQAELLAQSAAAIDRMEAAVLRAAGSALSRSSGFGVEPQTVKVCAKPEMPEHAVPVSVVPELTVHEPVAAHEREKAEKKYGEFKDIVLLGVANYPGVVARKIGEGQYRTEGDDLVDGAFVINNEKVAVCTFCTSDSITDRFVGEAGESFGVFLRSLVNELKGGHFTRVFMVFDGKLSGAGPYTKALNRLRDQIGSETFARFELFEGSPDVVIPELTERVSRMMDAARESCPDDAEIPPLSFRRQRTDT